MRKGTKAARCTLHPWKVGSLRDAGTLHIPPGLQTCKTPRELHWSLSTGLPSSLRRRGTFKPRPCCHLSRLQWERWLRAQLRWVHTRPRNTLAWEVCISASSWKGHPPPAPPPKSRAGPKTTDKSTMDAKWYHTRLMGWESRAVGTTSCSAVLLSSELFSRSRHSLLHHSARAGTGEAGTRQTCCQQPRLHLPLPNDPQLALPLEPFLKLQDTLIASHRMCCSRQPCQWQDGH